VVLLSEADARAMLQEPVVRDQLPAGPHDVAENVTVALR
jgi:hypothetical protein